MSIYSLLSILVDGRFYHRHSAEGIKTYVVNKVIAMSSDEETMKRERVFIGKLNLTLVAILKQEWPHNWPNFISDLVGSSKTSEVLCENNMQILKLLSEEVFDFSKDEMISEKAKLMKESLNSEFTAIYHLCDYILQNSSRPSSVKSHVANVATISHVDSIGIHLSNVSD